MEVFAGNEALAAAQLWGCDSNLICSMSHRDHPPPETHFVLLLDWVKPAIHAHHTPAQQHRSDREEHFPYVDRQAICPLEPLDAMKVFRRMASTLPMQIGSQANGIHSQYLISEQLHRNIWRAV